MGMRIHLELDSETSKALVAQAMSEQRPVPLQAAVMLRRCLGLPFPFTPTAQSNPTTAESEASLGLADGVPLVTDGAPVVGPEGRAADD
jgi:hypothetical protein